MKSETEKASDQNKEETYYLQKLPKLLRMEVFRDDGKRNILFRPNFHLLGDLRFYLDDSFAPRAPLHLYVSVIKPRAGSSLHAGSSLTCRAHRQVTRPQKRNRK